MDKKALNVDKKYTKNHGESGFTLAEVVVAVVILTFAIFSTWRVITSSINSITHQENRIKAIHIGQACLGKLEGEAFSKVVPENFIASTSGSVNYKLNESEILTEGQIVDKNKNDTIDEGDFGLYINGVKKDPAEWSYNSLEINIPDTTTGDRVYINYAYYHLIDEGSTPRLYKPLYAPLGAYEDESHNSDDNPYIVKLTNFPVDEEIVRNMSGVIYSRDSTSEDIPPPEPDSLWVDDYTINLSKGLLSFDDKPGLDPVPDPVWITYLPERATTDDNSDDYKDPIDDSIVGVVEGSFWDSYSGTTTTAITPTKCITVNEFWKQEGKIRKEKIEGYIQR